MRETYPEVSVMIVARPGEPRLARAVVSALMQRGLTLEVCVVLDGPCASNEASLATIQDSRVRVQTLPVSSGRGAARQRGLEMCRGEYVTFIDADDWILHGKLARQVRALRTSKFQAVSTSMLIVDGQDQLRGVRIYRGWRARGDETPGLAFPFAPMMVSLGFALAAGFDEEDREGEDRAFLDRLLPTLNWAVIPEPLYVYDEYSGASLGKIARSMRSRVSQAKRWGTPLRVAFECTRSAALLPLYGAAYGLGLGELEIARRSSRVTEDDRMAYRVASGVLVGEAKRHQLTGGDVFAALPG